MLSMTEMGLSLASNLPNGVKSKMYTSGLTLIPPPYNILFDNLCFLYRHLDDKKQLQEKINKLIEVAPIPNKSQLATGVKMASDVCEFKDMVVIPLIKEKINTVMPKIYELLDKIIIISPKLNSNMNMGELKQLVDDFSNILKNIKSPSESPPSKMQSSISPTSLTSPPIEEKLKKIQENLNKLDQQKIKLVKGGNTKRKSLIYRKVKNNYKRKNKSYKKKNN